SLPRMATCPPRNDVLQRRSLIHMQFYGNFLVSSETVWHTCHTLSRDAPGRRRGEHHDNGVTTMTRKKRAVLIATGAALAGSLALTGCGGPSGGQTSSEGIEAVDDGTTLSLWVRPGNEAVTDAIVQAYNESHENQVEITHVPAEQYVTKYAQAAQSGSLPDILAADLVFMPQIVDNGTAVDLTELLEDSGAGGHLAPAHVQASTADHRIYGVPYVIDT